jgi:hypothetical protein
MLLVLVTWPVGVFLYLLARQLCGRVVAAVALSASAFYYYFFKQCGFYMTEPLYGFLLGLATLIGLRAMRTGRLGSFLWFGSALGLSALARPNSLLLLPIAAAWPLAASGPRPTARRLLCAAFIGVGFLIPVLPWTARNYARFGSFVPVSTSMGMTLLGATCPPILKSRTGTWLNPQDTGLVTPAEIASAKNEVELDRLCRNKAIAYLAGNPREALQLFGWKFIRFWHLVVLPGDNKPNHLLAWLQYCCVLALAVLGVIISRSRWRDFLFLYGLIVAFCITGVVFNPDDRIRSSIEPFLVIFAAVGFCAVLRRLSERRPAPSKVEA